MPAPVSATGRSEAIHNFVSLRPTRCNPKNPAPLRSSVTSAQDQLAGVAEMIEEIAAFAASAGGGCRDAYIATAFVCGVPMAEIGEEIGLTRERIRQILRGFGLSSEDGGFQIQRHLQELSNMRERERHLNRRCREMYGCDCATVRAINGELAPIGRSGPCYSYRQLRRNARRRGIEFSLTLSEWWDCWASSGRWNERSGPDRYGMTRIDFRKGFIRGNVRICTSREAASAYQRQVMSRGEHPLFHQR